MKHLISVILLLALTAIGVNAEANCKELKNDPLMMAICEQDILRALRLRNSGDITNEQYELALKWILHTSTDPGIDVNSKKPKGKYEIFIYLRDNVYLPGGDGLFGYRNAPSFKPLFDRQPCVEALAGG